MAIEFNPNKINNATTSNVGKKRNVEQESGQSIASASEDKVSVNSFTDGARITFEPIKNAQQAKDMADQIGEQFRSHPDLARTAYGNTNSQNALNLLGETA